MCLLDGSAEVAWWDSQGRELASHDWWAGDTCLGEFKNPVPARIGVPVAGGGAGGPDLGEISVSCPS